MARQLTPGERFAERFEILELAAQGAMGAVYRAVDLESQCAVALKLQMLQGRDAEERFSREAQVLAGLSHPGLARYVGHGVAAREAFIALEWLDGESLQERLARGSLSIADAVTLALQLAEVLAYVHARGVVHRDLKPSNLFLRGRRLEDARIIDFGVARAASSRTLTTPGMLVGTPQYMSPEQARHASASSPAADVFSLGCVLYECISGAPLFEAPSLAGVLMKILTDEPPPLRQLCPEAPPWLEALLQKTLEKQPERRFPDGAALLAAFQKGAGYEPTRRATLPPLGLTRQNRQLLSVVLLGSALTGDTLDATSATFGTNPLEALIEAALSYGASAELLADGTLACLFWGSAVARDQATQAARLAATLQAMAPGLPIALATGRAELGGSSPLGEAVDRAAMLLQASADAGGALLVDTTTAGFLDARFELLPGEGCAELLSEREQEEPARTLLGRPTPFVGREAEFDTLQRALADGISSRQARAIVVTAVAGIGKSRLCHELWGFLRADGAAEVFFAQGDARRAGSAYSLLADLVRRACGVSEGQAPEHQLRRLRARLLRRLPPEVRGYTLESIGELLGLPNPSPSARLLAARQNPTVLGDQIRLALRAWLEAESAARPLVLILDDLHWGDLPSVRLLDAVLRAAAARPLQVVAFGRPESDALFPGLWAEHRRFSLALSGLPREASEALARELVDDDALVAQLIEQADGNTFFLEELLRAAAQGAGGETAVAVLEARIVALPAPAQDVLCAASILGDRFWPSGIAALLHCPAELPQEQLPRLLAEDLIRRSPRSRFSPEPEYSFRHSLVREAAYQLLTEEDRKLGHRLAGDWLLSRGERDPVTLAEHFHLGGDQASALEWYRAAAVQAMEGEDFARVLSLCARATEAGATGEARGEFTLLEADALIWCGRYTDAGLTGEAAMTQLQEGSPGWWMAAGFAAVGFGRSGQVSRVTALSQRLLRLPVTRASIKPRALALARAALWLFSGGRYELARNLAAACLSFEDELRTDPAFSAQAIHELLALKAGADGDPEAYLRNYEDCLFRYEEAGYLRHVSRVLTELSRAHAQLGDYQEALAQLPRALALAEQLQMPVVVAMAHLRQGQALLATQRPEEAEQYLRAAAEVFSTHRLPLQEANARASLSLTLLQLGRPEEAQQEAARGLASAPHTPTAAVCTRACLAWSMLALDRLAPAWEEAQNAYGLLRSLGRVSEGDALCRLAYIETALALGRREEARAALQTAREELHRAAATIGGQTRQQRFLYEVLENARLLALARTWLGD